MKNEMYSSSANLKTSTEIDQNDVGRNKSIPGFASPTIKRDSSVFVDCAVKIIKLDKEKMFDRLKYEISIMKMCRHDNIVLYYETFKHMQ